MKKILTLLLILALSVSVFAGCVKIKEVLPDSIKDKFPALRDDDTTNDDANQPSEDDGDNTGNEPGNEPGDEPGDEPAEEDLLADAYAYVHQMYKGMSEKTVSNYDLVTEVPIGDKVFAVTWEVSDASISIVPGTKENTVTVVLPQPAADLEYTLKFTVSDGEGNTLSNEFKHYVPMFVGEPAADSTLTIAQAIELALSKEHNVYTEGKYYVTGLIKEVYNTTYGNMRLVDEDDNVLTIYGTYSADGSVRYDALDVKPVAGDTVTIYGIIGHYNGTPQIKNGNITAHTPGDGGDVVDPPVTNDPTPDTELSIEAAIALGSSKGHDTYTTGKYYVTGEITEIYNTEYGNMKIKDADGNILTVYGTWNEDGTVRFDALETKPAVGDTIILYGVIGQYNGTPQMKNGWIVSDIADPPKPPVVPEYNVVDAPVANTAYKFGMVQGNLNDGNVYYIVGGMASTYYFATGTDVTKALDVYLETVEGGFHMYAMVDGVKTYINFVATVGDDGKEHVNAKYEAVASTVFTFNATLKTVSTVIGNVEYVLGTRNDKNYTTVGPVDVSKNGFYCQFYGEYVDAPACEHTNTEETVVDATCTVDGSKTVTCKDCGETLSTETLTATGHSHEAVVTAPTCTEAGYTTYTCACGDTYTGDEVEATGHTEGDAATCETAQTCTVCGDTLKAALGHAYVNGSCVVCGFCENHTIEQNVTYHPEMVSATCTEEGVAVFECTVCDYYYTEATPIDPEAHEWDWNNPQVITPADCATMTNGVNLYTCTACGATEEKESYAAHDFVETVVQATCTEDGSYYAVCSVCGYEESNVLEAEGHYNWYLTCNETGECMACGEEFTMPDHEGSPATCTEAMFCYNCFEFVGEPLGHNYVDGVCTNCGESESGPVTAVTPGTYLGTDDFGNQLLTVVVDETTVTFTYSHPMMGSTTVVANYYVELGEVVLIDPATETVLNPLAGALYIDANGLPTSAAYNGNNYTLLAEGSETPVDPVYPELVLGENTLTINDTWNGDTYTFTAAEDGTYNFIVGTNGMLVIEGPNGADVYFVGDTYSVECVAGDVLTLIIPVSDSNSNVAVITVELVAAEPACQHNSVTPTKVDATCTADGSYTVVCDDCGETVYSEVLTATGHSHEAVVTAPTCTEAGYTTYTCACGDTYTEDGEAATGHTEGAAATCTEAQTCTVCGETLVAALGHTEGDAATCETAQTCTVCGETLVAALGHSYGTWTPAGDDTHSAVCANDETHVLTKNTGDLLAECYALEKDATYGSVILEGVIVGIDTAYNSQYGNVSVVIQVGDYSNHLMLCYRLKGDNAADLKVGDVIKVTGTIVNYNGKIEYTSGCTILEYTAHTEHTYSEATCLELATCTICGETTGELGDHTYVDGACSVCGHEEGAAEIEKITASKTMAELITSEGWTDSTTKQSFNLDENVTVKVNGGANTGKAYNGDHIRIYATDTPAGTLTITLAEGYELVSIKVTTQTGTYAFLYVDGTTVDICNQTVAVSGSSVVLNSVKNGSNGKQVRVIAIEVVYQPTAA